MFESSNFAFCLGLVVVFCFHIYDIQLRKNFLFPPHISTTPSKYLTLVSLNRWSHFQKELVISLRKISRIPKVNLPDTTHGLKFRCDYPVFLLKLQTCVKTNWTAYLALQLLHYALQDPSTKVRYRSKI